MNMYSKTQVIEKLNSLLAYSKTQDAANAAAYQSLMQPLIDAVNGYYGADRASFRVPLNDLELALYNDIMKRGTVFEYITLPIDTDYPAAYTDLRKLFYTFPCMTVSNEVFHAAWVKSVDELTGQPIIKNNTLIDEWLADVGTAITDELSNIDTFYKWLAKAASNAGMMLLWEDMGRITSQPNRTDIADDIFLTKHFKECIDMLNLPAYKPSYI